MKVSKRKPGFKNLKLYVHTDNKKSSSYYFWTDRDISKCMNTGPLIISRK